MRLLLVEDNARLAALMASGLTGAGFVVDTSATLADAKSALSVADYDLLLLDIGLPDREGTSLLRPLRAAGHHLPVLIVTARGGLQDRVAGLDLGADDYLVKPFEMAELLARCRALLRRPGQCLGVQLTAGDVLLDTVAHRVTVAGHEQDLGRREFALLELLLRRLGQVVPRQSVEQALYSFDQDISPNAIEAVVSRLRKRLVAAGTTVTIHTVRGVGYLLEAP